MNADILREFSTDMQLAALREATVHARLAVLVRLAQWLAPVLLIDADQDALAAFERQFANLAPASIDIYVRHVQAFFRWALAKRYITVDPSVAMIRPQRVNRGRPHPTPVDDLRIVFACTRGALRTAYVLAAFAGLRCGEICRLRREHVDLDSACPTADIDGKGGKPRTVPLLAPVVTELLSTGMPRTGWVITRSAGRHYPPAQLSIDSHHHLRGLGIATTLHSMRHAFATTTYQSTRDLLLVKELLGHENVSSTQIYAAPDMAGVHVRLAAVADTASSLLGPRRLRAVR